MAVELEGVVRLVESPPATAGLYSSQGSSPTMVEDAQVTSDPFADPFAADVPPLQDDRMVFPIPRSSDESSGKSSPTVVVHKDVKHWPHFIYADAPMSASTDDDPTTQSYCSRPQRKGGGKVRHVNPCQNTETVLSLSDDTVDEASETRWGDESVTMAAPPPPLQYTTPSPCIQAESASKQVSVSPLGPGSSPMHAPPPSPETVVSIAVSELRAKSPDDDPVNDSRHHLPPQPPSRKPPAAVQMEREPVPCLTRVAQCCYQLRRNLSNFCCCLNADDSEEKRNPPPVNPFSQMPRRSEQVPHRSLDALEAIDKDEGKKDDRPTADDLASFRQLERDLSRDRRRRSTCCPQRRQ